jgi:hypothetical protein
MIKRLGTWLIIGLLVMGVARPAAAQASTSQLVAPDQAQLVAQNWLSVIVTTTGSWAGVTNPKLLDLTELKHGERLVGYFYAVEPRGFIVVSLRQELAPVQAYSDENNLDPAGNHGLIDLIKVEMDDILTTIESQAGPIETASTQAVASQMEIDYRPVWQQLSVDPAQFQQLAASPEWNYQAGSVLLTSSWHQRDPYNRSTPNGDGGRTVVGCVATAGAQLMRYWAWPPYGVGSHSYTWDGDQSCGGSTTGGTLSATFSDTYDWAHMANRYVISGTGWVDENGNPLTTTHLDAAAELSREAGIAVNMDYGFCESSAYTYDMGTAYQNVFRYSTDAIRSDRNAYTATAWFDRMKANFNVNRPIHYRVTGHSIVADGWRDTGNPIVHQYHMNYGWQDVSYNTWWALDGLHLGGLNEEYMLERIHPVNTLNAGLTNTTFPRDASFPYRYFAVDTTGSYVTFQSGQLLQFLPHVTVMSVVGPIRFEGTSALNTRLFTRGDTARGVRIISGTLRLNDGGGIRFN